MGGSAEVAGDQRSSPGYCYDADNTSLCAALSDELFGGQLTCSELAALVGAFADALITVRCGVRYLRLNPHGYTRVEGVTIAVQHRFYRDASAARYL